MRCLVGKVSTLLCTVSVAPAGRRECPHYDCLACGDLGADTVAVAAVVVPDEAVAVKRKTEKLRDVAHELVSNRAEDTGLVRRLVYD